MDDDFESTVSVANKLKGNRKFDKSEEKICYAWALYKLDNIEIAEQIFIEMEDSYSNYPQSSVYQFQSGSDHKDAEEKGRLIFLSQMGQTQIHFLKSQMLYLRNNHFATML